ncbi:hypothetical protein DH2020_047616 [Rehmannia glutinosa]|uniref:Acid phosphatase n=1 Tax=Rehmannia glutinosa TaxID=99300 RepID=A0ABR0U816_REHGL
MSVTLLYFLLLFLIFTTATISVTGNCLSWRLSVETNNIRDWKLVPKECAVYVRTYIEGGQYRRDSDTVADTAIQFAKSVQLEGDDGKDIWVFDIDETALSNLPFYARPDVSFGAKQYNWTSLGAWIMEGKAPALPSILRLYKELIELKYKVVFLTGSADKYEKARSSNLKNVGYTAWEKTSADKGTPTRIFKSRKRKELEGAGYRIIGNVGDQWGDLVGENIGNRTFKVPNPMYYVA